MWKRRLAWLIIIIAAAFLYLFSNESVTLALLLVCLLMPVVSAVVLLFSSKKVRVRFDSAEVNEENIRFKVVIDNPGILPMPEIEIPVRCTNLRTGETDEVTINGSAMSKNERAVFIETASRHSGRYELTSDNALVMDPLRLLSRKVAVDQKLSLTVMPKIFDMKMSVTNSAASMLDSEQYSRSRKGIEPGEVRSIREYVPGDPIKNIHWKLSEKTDKMLVKELELPVTDQIIVMLDTFTDGSITEDEMDAVASVYVSLMAALLTEGLEFSAGWIDPDRSRPVISKILSEEDFIAATSRFLAVPKMYQNSAVDLLGRELPDSRYAHIIIAGSQIPDDLDLLANGGQVTLLLCGGESSVAIGEGGNIIGFGEDSFEDDLAEIEV